MMITTRLGREVEVNEDYTIDQDWEKHTASEHARWDYLYDRQGRVLKGRAADEFLDGVHKLRLSEAGIPKYEELSDHLEALTGWRVVAVPDLVPDLVFFDHLANRRFPASDFIRNADQMDYLQEPDNFHDVFGHVPMLAHPAFADYMQAYGEGGLRAERLGVLHQLARLYWYTVEFGLVKSPDGLRIFGSGIVSSMAESVFCLEDPSPNRIELNLRRVMRTNYRIDDYQETYFVIDSFEALQTETLQDFTTVYEDLKGRPELEPADVLDDDVVLHRGTGDYEKARREERALLAEKSA